jgi:hypothetical protein
LRNPTYPERDGSCGLKIDNPETDEFWFMERIIEKARKVAFVQESSRWELLAVVSQRYIMYW